MGKRLYKQNRINLIICVLLAFATLAVYLQVIDFDFCHYDDDGYVENNPAVMAGLNPQTIKWAFTTNAMANWHPLTWISYFLDTEVVKWSGFIFDIDIGPGNAGLYHLSNVLVHIASAIILFLVLFELTGLRWRSAFVAALFALHPLHVESAAWISERKDVLSALFWFLTMWAYVRWVRRPEPRYYRTVVYMFVLGLMAKPMVVSLPIVMFILDFWPLRRFEPLAMEGGNRQAFARLFREKLPLFGISAASCMVTIWAQSTGGAVQTIEQFPLWVRVLNAFDATVLYLWKMIWPANLAALYPHPGAHISIAGALAAALLLGAITFLAVRLRRSHPYLLAGWLWYIITLLPVIGLVQVGSKAMADRYTYVPLIGVFVIVAWGVPELLSGLRNESLKKIALISAGIAVLAGLVPATYSQIGVWRDYKALFGHAITVVKDNAEAYNGYGALMVRQGDPECALPYLREALRISPGYLDARYNYGTALLKIGNLAAAEREFKRLLRQYPRHPFAQNNLGEIYLDRNNFGEAIKRYRLALRDRRFFQPSDEATVRNSLGISLVQSGRIDQAIGEFERAVKLDPNLLTAQNNLDRARALKE